MSAPETAAAPAPALPSAALKRRDAGQVETLQRPLDGVEKHSEMIRIFDVQADVVQLDPGHLLKILGPRKGSSYHLPEGVGRAGATVKHNLSQVWGIRELSWDGGECGGGRECEGEDYTANGEAGRDGQVSDSVPYVQFCEGCTVCQDVVVHVPNGVRERSRD